MSLNIRDFKWVSLTALLVFAVLLRIPFLNGSFWLDEAAQALESTRPFSQQLAIREDFQPPLLHYLLHFALYINSSEWWLRTIGALLPGLITIFYTYQIGALLKNKQVALVSSLLLTTSSFHIFYSQELRQYSLPAMFAVISWYMLLKSWKKEEKPTIQTILMFSLIQTAGLYSSYLYPFSLVAQLIWIIINRTQSLKRWLLAFTVTILLFLPWIPFFLDQLSAGTDLRTSLPGWETTVSHTQLKSLPQVASKFLFGVADVEINLIFMTLALVVIILFSISFFSKKNILSKISILSPLIYWLMIPIIFAWLISFFVPVLQPKRVLFCLPAFYLLITAISFEVHSKLQRILFFKRIPLLILLLFIINILVLFQYWTQPILQRENWKAAVDEIQRDFPVKSTVVFSFPAPFSPWVWYADSTYPALSTKEIYLTDVGAETTIKKAIEYDFVLVFDYLRDLTDPERKLEKELSQYGYKEVNVLDYPVIGFVRIYSKPEAVISYR